MAIISMFYIIILCIVSSFNIALFWGGKHYLHNQLLYSFPCIKGKIPR